MSNYLQIPCAKNPLAITLSRITEAASRLLRFFFLEIPDHSMNVSEGQEWLAFQKDAELSEASWSWTRSLGRQCLVRPGVAKSSFIEHYLSTFHKWTNTLNGPLSSWPHKASHGAGGWRDPSYQMRKTVGLRGHLMCSETWRFCIWITWRSRTSFCFAVNVRVQEAKADGRSLC